MKENNNYGLAIIAFVVMLTSIFSLIKVSSLDNFVRENAYMQVGGKEVYYGDFKKLMDSPEYQESQKMNLQQALMQLEQIRSQGGIQGMQPSAQPTEVMPSAEPTITETTATEAAPTETPAVEEEHTPAPTETELSEKPL